MKPKRLGRGLSNLLNRTEEEATAQGPSPDGARGRDLPAPAPAALRRSQAAPPVNRSEPVAGGVRALPISRVRSNPFQPRTAFAEAALAELQASIAEHGMLQPVVVREVAGGTYELVAGERRLRAAQALDLETLPAVVRLATDEDMQTLALVENLQREDLNAMEKSRALKSMMRNFGLTQEDVARRVGKARTTVANLLRLLDLPTEVQGFVEEGRLTGAHARAVLQAEGAGRRLDLAQLAVAKGLSVREVERLARKGPTIGKRRRAPQTEDPYVRDLEQRLTRALATEVRIRPQGKRGRIEVRYDDAEQLERLLELWGA